ncbi:MAG: metal-dependent hydrolase [Phycisphaerales bacterium]|nr:metal-dependent hydrolase [Phycisphaerales bacterium]
MTYIGHTLTGLAIGAAVLPGGLSRRRMLLGMAVFALLADVPDFPLRGWGHDRYDISHSIFVNGGIIAVVLLGLWILGKWKGLRVPLGVRVGGVCAWFSHMLLDSMYNHGLGIRIYWPVSSESLVLPVPWFSTLEYSPPPMNAHTARVFAIELACYLPLLLVVLIVRHGLILRARRKVRP